MDLSRKIVEIAMPTHNCAPWLGEFMNSLIAQDFANWRFFARDDGSTDETGRLLSEWQTRLKNRMVVLSDSGTRNLGVIGNYNRILEATSTDWVMSADPDDVWLPCKISTT